MRKLYSKALAHHFEINKSLLWNGKCIVKKGKGRTICEIWQTADEVAKVGFVRLRAHVQAESFGVDIGWSHHQVVEEPAFNDPRYFDFHGEALAFSSYTISLRLLMGGHDHLWDIISADDAISDPMLLVKPLDFEEALSETNESFKDALNDIVESGIPYVNKALIIK